jgi:hypothetical protein
VLTIDQLPDAYAKALAEALAAASSPEAGPGLCRYCGVRWIPLPGSKLTGHALCVVTPEFRAALEEMYRASPKLTRQALAYLLGVSISTVVAWTKPRTIENGRRWRDAGGSA